MQRLEGVTGTAVGYSGGNLDYPCYKLICTGATNHAEVVYVAYDPKVLSLADLLRRFFAEHDPTQLNQQGLDVGTQYRSCVFYEDEEDLPQIEEVLKEQRELYKPEPVHT